MQSLKGLVFLPRVERQQGARGRGPGGGCRCQRARAARRTRPQLGVHRRSVQAPLDPSKSGPSRWSDASDLWSDQGHKPGRRPREPPSKKSTARPVEPPTWRQLRSETRHSGLERAGRALASSGKAVTRGLARWHSAGRPTASWTCASSIETGPRREREEGRLGFTPARFFLLGPPCSVELGFPRVLFMPPQSAV